MHMYMRLMAKGNDVRVIVILKCYESHCIDVNKESPTISIFMRICTWRVCACTCTHKNCFLSLISSLYSDVTRTFWSRWQGIVKGITVHQMSNWSFQELENKIKKKKQIWKHSNSPPAIKRVNRNRRMLGQMLTVLLKQWQCLTRL